MGSRVQCNMHRSSVATEPDQRKLARPVVLVAKADQDVGLVIVMHAVPKIDRRRYVTKRDLVKYGYTDECQACTQLASGMHNAKVLTTTDAEIALASSWRKTTTRDKLSECRQEPSQSVGELTVRVGGPVEDQPVPTVRVGGSSSSGTRAGSAS